MSETTFTHDEVIDLLDARDLGPDEYIANIHELIAVHRSQAWIEGYMSSDRWLQAQADAR